MAEGDLYLNCTNLELSVEDLLRIVCVASDCDTGWFDCDNNDRSLEDMLRLLVREDASGNPALAVCGCSGGTSTATIKQNVEGCLAGVPFTPTGWGANFADTTYSLNINIYGAGGASVGFTLDSKTVGGFTITPTANGDVNWTAINT